MSLVGNSIGRDKEEINEKEMKGESQNSIFTSHGTTHLPTRNKPTQKPKPEPQDGTSSSGSILCWCQLLSWWNQRKSLLLHLFYLWGAYTKRFIYEAQETRWLFCVWCLSPVAAVTLVTCSSPMFLEDAEPLGETVTWGTGGAKA